MDELIFLLNFKPTLNYVKSKVGFRCNRRGNKQRGNVR